jgi:serine palmitoyltransferase
MKRSCAGVAYSSSISPPAVQQIISALTMILGEDGTDIGSTLPPFIYHFLACFLLI